LIFIRHPGVLSYSVPSGKQLELFRGRSLDKLTLQAVSSHRLVAFAATSAFLNCCYQ
jgi:hypothetical protein